MDVGEPEVAARVAIGELRVVEAELVENGGVKVVEMDTAFNRRARNVASSVLETALDAASRHPHGVAAVVMAASVGLVVLFVR